MMASPAAGPLTLVFDPLKKPTTIPPMIPEIIPLIKGAPEARAIPRHRGRATKKVTMEAEKSLPFILFNCWFAIVFVCDFGKM